MFNAIAVGEGPWPWIMRRVMAWRRSDNICSMYTGRPCLTVYAM